VQHAPEQVAQLPDETDPPERDSLTRAIAEVDRDGWSTVRLGIGDIATVAASAQLRVVTWRGNAVEILKPILRNQARRRSLSAHHGLGEFPMHTDAAHWARPPRYVVLQCISAFSPTPTKLLRFPPLPIDVESACRQGIFLVGWGRNAFHATISDGHRIRFDPGCMKPLDHQAWGVATYLEKAAGQAVEFHWNRPELSLIIDNHATLHGRGHVVDPQRRRLARIYLEVDSD